MTSIVKQFQYPELSRTSNGGRRYVVGEKRLPSVTTILDACTDKTWLIEWKKRVGESEAKRISTESSNCLLYTSPSPRDLSTSRMPSSA